MILSGHNFSLAADAVFAHNYMHQGQVRYGIRTDFAPKNQDIVFCKTDFILNLFGALQRLPVKNLGLITHESDFAITEQLFVNRPSCIKVWYAQNIAHADPCLKPIPIGLADAHCNITLKADKLLRLGTVEKLLYVNHRVQNNPRARAWIYEHFKNSDWCTVHTPDLSLDEYKSELDRHQFILCPAGNGIDTHRCWEALYHGIIPIVERHLTMSTLEDLPAIVVDDFRSVTKEFLLEQYNKLQNQTTRPEKLQVEYWIQQLRQDLNA